MVCCNFCLKTLSDMGDVSVSVFSSEFQSFAAAEWQEFWPKTAQKVGMVSIIKSLDLKQYLLS